MENGAEERLALLEEMIRQKRKATLAHAQYLAQNREYDPGEKLYMREVHFVMAVGPGEGRTMSELAARLDVTQGAVSQLAARLEKKGYVRRGKDGADKRQIVATLTPKGEALYTHHTEYDHARYLQISEALANYSNEQLRLFTDYERTIKALFDYLNGTATANPR